MKKIIKIMLYQIDKQIEQKEKSDDKYYEIKKWKNKPLQELSKIK